MRARRIRVEVIADFREEQWPSMDLAAEMLVAAANVLPEVQCELIRPRLWRLTSATRDPAAVDRAIGRFVQYPLRLLTRRDNGAFFHVADHSYGHLVHALPRGRTGVYCHDLDAFQAALRPARPSSSLHRALAALLMSGLRSAALVFYSTEAVRAQLLEAGLVRKERLVHAPFGISSEFVPRQSDLDARVKEQLGGPFVLNVGSCIPRKNVPFLLKVFAALKQERPELRLVQVGGTWTADQRALLVALGVADAVTQLRGIPREDMAAYYRQAELVLLPTRAEGFGLPLTEAIGCGSTVLASRLPVLLEVGGIAARYAAVDDETEWVRQSRRILRGEEKADPEQCRLQAARFSWGEHARVVMDAYAALGDGWRGATA